MKLEKGINPIGTRHAIPTMTPKGLTSPVYQVSRVIGGSTFFPNQDILVELAIVPVRTEHYYAPYLTISLLALASDSVPVTEEDVFWQAQKTD